MKALKLIAGGHMVIDSDSKGSKKGKKTILHRGDIMQFDLKMARETARYKVLYDLPENYFKGKDGDKEGDKAKQKITRGN